MNKIIQCGDCDNWDDSWTNDTVGYCPMTDTFWFPYEFCSRAEEKKSDDGQIEEGTMS